MLRGACNIPTSRPPTSSYIYAQTKAFSRTWINDLFLLHPLSPYMVTPGWMTTFWPPTAFTARLCSLGTTLTRVDSWALDPTTGIFARVCCRRWSLLFANSMFSLYPIFRMRYSAEPNKRTQHLRWYCQNWDVCTSPHYETLHIGGECYSTAFLYLFRTAVQASWSPLSNWRFEIWSSSPSPPPSSRRAY